MKLLSLVPFLLWSAAAVPVDLEAEAVEEQLLEARAYGPELPARHRKLMPRDAFAEELHALERRRTYVDNGPLASNTSYPPGSPPPSKPDKPKARRALLGRQAPPTTTTTTTTTATTTTATTTTRPTTTTAASPTTSRAPNSTPRSNVPYGRILKKCTVPGTAALTFDDGPWAYTNDLLNLLRTNGVVATFFLNGYAWGNITDPDKMKLVRRMWNEGHMIGSHTQTHADLATLDRTGIVNQMNTFDDIFRYITAQAPVYMRAPYLSTNALVLKTLTELAFHVIDCDIDTKDYANDSPGQIQVAKDRFTAGLNAGGTIELTHDTHRQTVYNLTQFMIDGYRSKGLRMVTIGECMGDPKANWYRR